MLEIVGAKIGDIITNNPAEIIAAVEQDREIIWLSRIRMQAMSKADLGIIWDKMAESLTLFILDNNVVRGMG